MIRFFKDKFFQRELKREARTFIVVAVGFSIAFAWRQTTFDAALTVIHKFFSLEGEIASSILASLLITFIGILIIILGAKFLKDSY